MAKPESENPEVRQLREIKRELRNIESNTSAKWWIVHGMLYGAGWIIGSLLAVLIIGWALSIAGVIPGLDKIAAALQGAFAQIKR
ncbi:MAG: hypothetical protein P4L81_05580 [Candidatus Pacebacteria bacterium]|nr:hypothetical protein [Candidatus Paceibacterota bacterium]